MTPRLCCLSLLLALATAPVFRGAANEKKDVPDPKQPYQAERSNPVTYEVDFSTIVTPPYKTKVLKVWLPLPPSDAGQEVEEKELTSFPMSVTPKIAEEPMFGN